MPAESASTNPRHGEKKRSPSAPSPFAAFTRLESQRQSEWLFNRHRPKRPAWKRD